MYFVAGITGNTGSVVARTLLAQGQKVRSLVRRPEAAAELARQGFPREGLEIVEGELSDQNVLERSLQGIRGAYFLVPPLYGENVLERQAHIATSIAGALSNASLERTVLLSSIGAELSKKTGPIVTCYDLEQKAGQIPGVTFLRAAFFQENWLAMLVPAKNDGVLPSFLPETSVPMVATEDIGRCAARLLTQKEDPARIVQLAGPVEASAADAAQALGAALERKVEALTLPVAGAKKALLEAQLPEENALLLAELYQALHDNLLVFHEKHPLLRGENTLEKTFAGRLGAPSSSKAS